MASLFENYGKPQATYSDVASFGTGVNITQDLFLGSSQYYITPVANEGMCGIMDNFKVYNYAKTDFSDRTSEGAGMPELNSPYFGGGDQSGLLVWNKIESASGGVISSEVGQNFQEYGGSMVYQDAKYGKGAYDGGANKAVDFTDTSVLKRDAWTIEMWYKYTDLSVTNGIPSSGMPHMWTDSLGGGFLHRNSTNETYFVLRDGVSYSEVASLDWIDIAQNDVVHWALVYDFNGIEGSGDMIRIYYHNETSGQSGYAGAAKGSFTGIEDRGTTSGYRFGRVADVDGTYRNRITLDNVKIWDYAKTNFSDRFSESGALIVPAPGSVDVPVTQNIEFAILDDDSGVDLSTVRATITTLIPPETNIFYTGMAEFSAVVTDNGYVIEIDPSAYDYAETVTVDIYAEDNQGNDVSTVYNFTTVGVILHDDLYVAIKPDGSTDNISPTDNIRIENELAGTVVGHVSINAEEMGIDLTQVDLSEIIISKNEEGFPFVSIPSTNKIAETLDLAGGTKYMPIKLGPFASAPIITVSTGNGFVAVTGYEGSSSTGVEAGRISEYAWDQSTGYVTFKVNKFSTYGTALVSTVNILDLPVTGDANTTYNITIEVVDTSGNAVESAPVTVNLVSGTAIIAYPDGRITNAGGTLNVEVSFSDYGDNSIEAFCDVVTSSITTINIVDTTSPFFGGGDTTGLILWNKLGSPEEVANSEVGEGLSLLNSPTYEAAVYDDGAFLSGSNVITMDWNDFWTMMGQDQRITLEMWITYKYALINGFGGNGQNYQFSIGANTNSLLCFQMRNHSSVGTGVWVGNSGVLLDAVNGGMGNVAVGEKVHIAMVIDRSGIDGTSETARLYKNGQVIYSTTASITGDWIANSASNAGET